MLQNAARESGEQYKFDPNVLRETITTTITALAEGKIKPHELPIQTAQGQRSDAIRVAPGLAETKLLAGQQLPRGAYTVEALAKFLGEVQSDGRPHEAFRNVFSFLELQAEGLLTEGVWKSLESEAWKIGDVVRAARQQRDAAVKEAEHVAALAERKRQEAIRSTVHCGRCARRAGNR